MLSIKKKDRKKLNLRKDKVKSTGRKKMHSPKDNRNSAFRNNYKHYQYDYEEDFYEPY